MKKVFFSFVIVAAALLVVSCGNKTNGGNEADSTATEEVAVKELKVDEVGPGVATTEDFTVDIPEGWKIENLTPGYTKFSLRTPNDQAISIDIEDGKAEEYKADWKKLDDKTIGGKTYIEKEDGSFRYLLNQIDDSKFLAVFLFHVDSNDPIIPKVIESIKLK